MFLRSTGLNHLSLTYLLYQKQDLLAPLDSPFLREKDAFFLLKMQLSHMPGGCCFLTLVFCNAAAHREFLDSPATIASSLGSGNWSNCWKGPITKPESVGAGAVYVSNVDCWEGGDGRPLQVQRPPPGFPQGTWGMASPCSLSREVCVLEHLPHDLLVSLSCEAALYCFILYGFSYFVAALLFFSSLRTSQITDYCFTLCLSLYFLKNLW